MAAKTEVCEYLPKGEIYDGLQLPPFTTPSKVEAVKDIKFTPEDVLIITYPKSGTDLTIHDQ